MRGPVEGAHVLVPQLLADEGDGTVLGHLHQIEKRARRLTELSFLRCELTEDYLVYPGVRSHPGHVRPVLAPVVPPLRLVRYPHSFLGRHPFDELPRFLDMLRTPGDREGEPPAPGDELRLTAERRTAFVACTGHRSGRYCEIQVGGVPCNHVREPVTVYLHGHETGEERVELIGFEPG